MQEAHRHTRHVIRAASQGQAIKVIERRKSSARIAASLLVRQLTVKEFRALEISDEALNAAINQAVAEGRE